MQAGDGVETPALTGEAAIWEKYRELAASGRGGG